MPTACETLGQLKQARLDLLSGKMVRRVRIQTGNVEKDLQYQTADLPSLERAIAEYEGLCAAESGTARPKRFAIRGG